MVEIKCTFEEFKYIGHGVSLADDEWEAGTVPPDDARKILENVSALLAAADAEKDPDVPVTITDQVAEFNAQFGYPDRRKDGPTLPSFVDHNDLIKCMRLAVDDFSRLMTAFGVTDWHANLDAKISDSQPGKTAEWGPIALALARLDCGTESMRLYFGIPRVPVAIAVHKSLMASESVSHLEISEILRREKQAAEFENSEET